MSCGRPTDQKLFAGYIRGVRVTASWGATCTTPGNHLRAYFDLRVVVWLTLAGLGMTGVTGLFLSNENTVGPAIDLLALVLREASRDRR